jgi:hypothetical protein
VQASGSSAEVKLLRDSDEIAKMAQFHTRAASRVRKANTCAVSGWRKECIGRHGWVHAIHP